MFRTFLSWRYLVHRRTNLIGITGIFVGVAALILILSIMTGFLEGSRETIRGSLSDIVVKPSSPSPEEDRWGQPVDELLALIEGDPRVEAAAPHLNWYGILSLPGRGERFTRDLMSDSQHGDLNAVQLVGIDVEAEFRATDLRAALTRESTTPETQVADPDDPFAMPPEYRGNPDEAFGPDRYPTVIVGEQLFKVMGLYRGAELNVFTARPDPETGEFATSTEICIVAGSFRSRDNEMDLDRIYFDRRDLATTIQSETDFSEVLVKCRDYDRDGQALKLDLREELYAQGLIRGKEREVQTWEEFRGVLIGAIENERVLMGIMLSLVLIVAGFTIFAILSMMVTEKRRDIGILTALGATPKGVLQVFLLIAFWDALLGVALGAWIGIWGAFRIDSVERWLSSTLGVEIFDRSVYLFDHIPSEVEPMRVTLIVLGAFSCALLFAAIPAWKAARMDPLEALRNE